MNHKGVLLVSDYSELEVQMLAHLSQDPAMKGLIQAAAVAIAAIESLDRQVENAEKEEEEGEEKYPTTSAVNKWMKEFMPLGIKVSMEEGMLKAAELGEVHEIIDGTGIFSTGCKHEWGHKQEWDGTVLFECIKCGDRAYRQNGRTFYASRVKGGNKSNGKC